MGISSTALYNCILTDLQLAGVVPVRETDGDSCLARALALGNAKYVAAGRLLTSIVKKFQDEIEGDGPNDSALALFRENNERCKNFSYSGFPGLDYILGQVKLDLQSFFYRNGDCILNDVDVLKYADVGPGAAVEASGFSFLEKIGNSKLTATRSYLGDMYSSLVKTYPLWEESEKSRRETHGETVVVEGSRLSFAPKTSQISRVIAIEPSLNMFMQKGVQRILEERIRECFGIDFATQPSINAELARRGSLNGCYATIDLKSASDLISLKLMRDLLPREVFNYFSLLRSPRVQIGEGKGVESLELHMMCNMGNAFCFPLQTIVFACIVTASYRLLGLKIVNPAKGNRPPIVDELTGLEKSPGRWIALGNWGVFGDDIICLTKAADFIVKTLHGFGFVVNRDKSYTHGLFRESCGSDWYNGQNVRGVYCKTLKTPQSVCSLINRLNIWSAMHDIPLVHTIGRLKGTLRNPPYVPPFDLDDSGIRVPSCLASIKMISSHGTLLYLYKRYRVRPSRVDVGEESPLGRANPSAVLLSAVKGTLRCGRLTIRLYKVAYSYKTGVSPCWDVTPREMHGFRASGWQRWSTAVMRNLTDFS